MRLIQSVLAALPQTKKSQRKFIAHLLGLILMLPGHATFRNLSRYSSYHERTFSRWYDRRFDFVALNKAAIAQGVAPEHHQALVIDTTFIRSEKGLEVSAIAWLDITDNCAYGLSVEQTPPSDKGDEPQTTRIDTYLDQLRRVVHGHRLQHLRYVITDGYGSKRRFLDGVRALGMHQIGKLRRDAKLHVHFNASLSALTFCKLEARQQNGEGEFSMASVKRRAFNQHLLERIFEHLAQGHSLEKSSPHYQDLCDYGTINQRAA